MSTTVQSYALSGVSALPVQVKIDLLTRLPSVVIVGMPGAAVRETADRVRCAIQSAEMEFPRSRVVVSLAPAELPKRGCGLDLPIALGVLVASGQLDGALLAGCAVMGELSLEGTLRPIRGALPMILAARAAGITEAIIPEQNGAEVYHVPGIRVWTARALSDVLAWVRSGGTAGLVLATCQRDPVLSSAPSLLDMADLPADLPARRAVEISAVGGHPLMMVGPQGCGKCMLAARLPGILPEMSAGERETVTCIQSAAGMLAPGAGLVQARPFRAPHHTISAAGMLGNAAALPGEITLAHQGVLFLDELPEFSRHVTELLPGTLREGQVSYPSSEGRRYMPAAPLLVGAMNPCPCGYRGHPIRSCTCSPESVARYQERVTSARLPFEMRIELAPLPRERSTGGETSAAIRERVTAARALLATRTPDPVWPDTVQMRIARSIAALAGRLDLSDSDMDEAATYLAA